MKIANITVSRGLLASAITHPFLARGVLREMSKVRKCVKKLQPELSALALPKELPDLPLGEIEKIWKDLVVRVEGQGFPCLVLLYLLCRKNRAISIVETGVENGYSSSFFLQAINDGPGGRLYSIDLPLAEYPRDGGEVDRSYLGSHLPTGWVVPKELRGNWELILGDSRKELPKLLDRLGSIDIFNHDDEHTYANMISQYRLTWTHLKSGGLLLSDDVNRNHAFVDFCKEKGGQAEFLVTCGGRTGVMRKC